MNKPAPRFRPIASPLDVPDEALNELGDKLGVPNLVKPEKPPSLSGSRQVAAPNRDATSLQPEADQLDPPLEKLSVMLPDYLMLAMRQRAALERSSSRYYVMLGLQAIGFAIEPGDLISDGRRAKSKKR